MSTPPIRASSPTHSCGEPPEGNDIRGGNLRQEYQSKLDTQLSQAADEYGNANIAFDVHYSRAAVGNDYVGEKGAINVVVTDSSESWNSYSHTSRPNNAFLLSAADLAPGRAGKIFVEAAFEICILATAQKLRDYARQNKPELYKQLAFVLLKEITGVDVPPGVFTPFPKKGKRGRKPVPDRLKVYNAWMSLGQPLPLSTPVLRKIARIVYERECDKGMRDKFPKYIERELEAINRRLEQELAERKQEPAKSEAGGLAPQISR